MPSTFAFDVRPQTLIVVRADIETAFYSTIALLIYDHLLTLSEEVCTSFTTHDLFDETQ